VSGNPVPLTVIKGASHEFIPLPQGANATVADFHSYNTLKRKIRNQSLTFYSIQTQTTDAKTYLTSGFYKIEAGPANPLEYACEETKYVISGQIDVLDEATGITHHLVAGDFAFFYVGSKVQFSTKSSGMAFYAVTRPVKAAHPNLKGREEDVKAKSRL
jgi:ethanolamine utilization protein EutQ (cupin superfamily)